MRKNSRQIVRKRHHSRLSTAVLETLELRQLMSSYVITSPNDTGEGTLRDAIAAANANPGSDAITFNLGAGVQTINLANGLPFIAEALTITGPSAGVTIDGGGHLRTFVISPGVSASMSRLTITHGETAIYNRGTLTLTDSTVTNNIAGPFETGAGISIVAGASAALTNVTVSNNLNENASGGGVSCRGGTLTMTNCTVTNNSAMFGGGVDMQSADLTLINCTIANNSTMQGGGGLGLGNGTVSLINSIIAGNTGNTAPDIYGNAAGSNNIIGDNSGMTGFSHGVAGNQVGTSGNPIDPKLAALADNGGRTKTMALLPTSPAIDNAVDVTGVTTDQRGNRRTAGLADIGAYEIVHSLVVTTTADEDNGRSDPLFGNGTSLREAIAYANSHPGADSITFDSSVFGIAAQTINLATALPNLSDHVSISGPSASRLTVRGNGVGSFNIFSINPATTVTLSGMTISNGRGYNGGGITSYGTLTVQDCVVTNNRAFGAGGGIFSDERGNGSLTLIDSTISNNTSDLGAGGVSSFGTLSVSGCTISGNFASTGGGFSILGAASFTNTTISGNNAGFGLGGGIRYSGTAALPPSLTLTNCTITGNRANGANGDGGVSFISNDGVLKTANNTIISGNFLNSTTTASDVSGPLAGTNNLIGGDAMLAPLTDNGGPTKTHALLLGSPAINAGGTALAVDRFGATLQYDQRGPGFPRRVGGSVDMGAFELQNTPPITSGYTPVQVLEDFAPTTISVTNAFLDNETAEADLVYSVQATTGNVLASATINNSTDKLTLTFAANANGVGTVVVRATDPSGEYAEATLSVTVLPVNDAPIGANKTLTLAANATYTFTTADFPFSDPNDSPTNTLGSVTIKTLPALGALSNNGAPVAANQVIPAADIASGKLKFTPALNGSGAPYANFTFQIRDNGGTANGGMDVDTIARTMTINVTAPVNTAPSNVVVTPSLNAINENSSVAINVSFTDPNSTEARSLKIEWGDGAIENVTLATGATTYASGAHKYLDDSPTGTASDLFNIKVTVTDSFAASASATAQVRVNNVAPVGSITGAPAQSVVGTAINLSSTTTDVGTLDTFTRQWTVTRDGAAVAIAGGTGATQSFTPTLPGTYVVTYTAKDDDTGTSTPASKTIIVHGGALGADPTETSKQALFVGGTNANDVITVCMSGSKYQVTIQQGSTTLYSQLFTKPTGKLIVNGLDGNDIIVIDPAIASSQLLYAGAGNDVVYTSNGTAVVLGGDGNDIVYAGNGRDLLIGGSGTDLVLGGDGDDILIGGTTSFDAFNNANQIALSKVLSEWNSSPNYSTRMNHLTGATPNGLNASYFLKANQTVFDDGAKDSLVSGNGQDWFFAKTTGAFSDATDKQSNETLTLLN